MGDRLYYRLPYAMEPLSVLSVTLVYCGQMVSWIKIPLAIQVGLGAGHIVLLLLKKLYSLKRFVRTTVATSQLKQQKSKKGDIT